MLHLACNKNGLGGWGGVGVVIYLVSGEVFPFVFVHSFYQHLRCIQCKLIALKKMFMPKSNICGHIMPTNNLKQVFYQKALVKIEHVRKQSLFVSSGLMVFTQCVCVCVCMSCI